MEGKSYINFNEDRLPEVFEFRCGKLFYKEAEYVCQEYGPGVREDGPDAWGALVDIPQNSFVRSKGLSGYHSNWYYVSDNEDIWLTMVGSEIEYIHIGPDDAIEWLHYKAIAL